MSNKRHFRAGENLEGIQTRHSGESRNPELVQSQHSRPSGNLITDTLDLWASATLTKSTAGRGSNGKLQAYGIKKLRELILELAVRGKLVSQDPNEEPASVLLERIAKEKARLLKEGKIKKKKPLPVVSDEDKLFDVPAVWGWVRLGDVVEIVRGITFPSSEKSRIAQEGRVACLRTTNVQDKIEWDDMLFIREEFINIDEQFIRVNDIVMSTANSRELVGKVAIVEYEPKKQTAFGGFLSVLRPILLDAHFVMILLRTPVNRNTLIDSASQTTNIANISIGKLNPLVLAIPPLAEQRRIVAKVDELMALCDQLEQEQAHSLETHQTLVETLLGTLTSVGSAKELAEAWSRIADHFDTLFTTEHSIDQLKQTILQLAVVGKLVPQDPSDEPVRVTLQKAKDLLTINEDKKGSIKENIIPEQEILFSIPNGWAWSFIEEFCDVQGGIQKQPKRQPKKNHYPYLRVANVQRGYIDIGEMSRFELEAGELEKWVLKEGDVLVVEGNGSEEEIGRCAIWNGEIMNCVYQNHLIRVRTHLKGMEEFVSRFLNSPAGIEEMKRLAVTTSGLYNLSVGKIRSIAVPLPPVDEQHRIVAKVDELMALCDALKARLADAQTIEIRLADAIVERAAA